MGPYRHSADCMAARVSDGDWMVVRLEGYTIGRICNWKARHVACLAIGWFFNWIGLCNWRLIVIGKVLQLDGNCWGSWRNLADCKTVRVLYSHPVPSIPCLITFSLFIVKRRAAGRWPPPVARKKEATVTHPTQKKLRFKHSQPSNCFQGRRYVLNLPCVVVSLSSSGFSVLCGKGSQPRIPSPWRLNRRAFNVDRG